MFKLLLFIVMSLGSGMGEKVLGTNNFKALPIASLASISGDEFVRLYDEAGSPLFQKLKVSTLVDSQVPQNNLNATTDPDPATDDSSEGYSVGSIWINQNTGESYKCFDATEGAALWVNTSLTTDDLATVAISGDYSDLTGTPDLSLYAALADDETITGNWTHDSHITIAEITEPSTPASGYGALYSKSGGKLYWKDDEGNEYDLTASGFVDGLSYTPYLLSLEAASSTATIQVSTLDDETYGQLKVSGDNTSNGSLKTYSSNAPGGSLGLFAKNFAELSSEGAASAGLIVKTGTEKPLHFGTDDTLSATIDGSTQDWDFNGHDITEAANITRTGLLTVDATTGIDIAYNGTTQLSIEDDLVEVQNDFRVLANARIGDELRFSDGVGFNKIYNNGSNELLVESRVQKLILKAGVNDSNKRDIEFQTGNTMLAKFSSATTLGTGTVYTSSGTFTNTNPSDRQLKENLTNFNYGLKEVLQMKHYWGNYKNEDRLHAFWIAQEVLPVLPEFVDNSEKYLGLNTEAMVVLNQRAIQELYQLILKKH